MLKINIGLSRKLSKDFNSEGFSFHLEGELPSTAINEPETIAQQAEYLFGLAHDVLNAQMSGRQGDGAPSNPPSGHGTAGSSNDANGSTYRLPRNGSNNAGSRRFGSSRPQNGNGKAKRGITDAQTRALNKMAQKVGSSGDQVARDEFGLTLAGLDIKQASDLIDQLKQQIESQPQEAA